MVVTGEPTAAPAQRYPDLAVVCHTPLRPGSAPAASFYTEEGGAVSTTTELATLPVGSCASESAIALPVAAFCVANDQDTPYKNQLLDLEHDGFYRMIVHADPGCNIYESGTLTYFGQTYPKAKAKLPRQAPTPVPAATLTPLPAATLTPTPAPL